MIYITVISVLIAGISIGYLCYYRNQIRRITHDIKFIMEHHSNRMITQEISSKEITELVETVNELSKQYYVLVSQVIQKEELLKDIVTNLSHDIRTPLTSLDGYFQLLTESVAKDDCERYTRIIDGRIKNLQVLLEELFTYMKLQNDSYELAISPCNVTQILYDTVFSFYDQFSDQGLEPVIDLLETPIKIDANETGLSRAFQNIIKNALDHGKNFFSLSARCVEDNLILQFENDYPNGNELDISKVFERFYKANPARTGNSTGLGLAIAKGLIERMGGSIQAELTEQHNFLIEVHFPLKQKNDEEH